MSDSRDFLRHTLATLAYRGAKAIRNAGPTFADYGGPLAVSAEKLFQGPIADALTHVGQIAMLRRMAGIAIKGENFFVAEIGIGRVGAEQTPPRKEF